ncbi:MAG: hypothetical protein ACXIUM_07415 [Wenzhouxiangella sp.]
MNKMTLGLISAGLMSSLIATPISAQQTARDFPSERTSQSSCNNVNWNANMLEVHPRLIDACQEVVVVEGNSWARFDVRFKELMNDGTVVFDIRDRNGRAVEQASFMPVSGQQAYLNGRATPFRQLRSTDEISLYVPEGQYGFATQPGVPAEQVAQRSAPASSPAERRAPVVTDRSVAQVSPRQSVLPATAGSLPWLALFGLFSLFGATILTVQRLR